MVRADYAPAWAWSLCRRAMRRDLRRAALLRCSTPLLTPRSRARRASCTASRVMGSFGLAAMALRAWVTCVRTADLMERLRARRFSSMRMRFFADGRFGMASDFLLCGPTAPALGGIFGATQAGRRMARMAQRARPADESGSVAPGTTNPARHN